MVCLLQPCGPSYGVLVAAGPCGWAVLLPNPKGMEKFSLLKCGDRQYCSASEQ